MVNGTPRSVIDLVKLDRGLKEILQSVYCKLMELNNVWLIKLILAARNPIQPAAA